MKPTTNVYLLIDNSFYAKPNMERWRELFLRYERTLRNSPFKTKLHFIGYNDKARFLSPKEEIPTFGNPDLKEGLKLLDTTTEYQRKYTPYQTRPIFLLFSSGKVLLGWRPTLERLFRTKEFSTGLRYAITTKNTSQFFPFTERTERILPYFSESRLLAVVKTLNGEHASRF